MKYLDEYRDADAVRRLAAASTPPPRGRGTSWKSAAANARHHSLRAGCDAAAEITLIHGPGCPVCVTPTELIDKAVAIAGRPEVIFCSFGDMLRVPGSQKDLFTVKSEGGDVRVVYSPMDAVALGPKAPGPAGRVLRRRLRDHRPGQCDGGRSGGEAGAEELLGAGFARAGAAGDTGGARFARESRPGLLAAGHVCTVAGMEEYRPIAEAYRVPIVVTGFEPVDILQGVLLCVKQLEAGRHEVENQYARCVRPEGNRVALQEIAEVFQVVPRKWRGIGEIPASGLALREAYAAFDAERRFNVADITADEPAECIAGEILQGHRNPHDCPAFGVACTPERPLGARWFRPKGPARPIIGIGGGQ